MMMKNKKGGGMWLSLFILIITTTLLSYALVKFNYKYNSQNQHGFNEYIGQRQSALVSSYQEAERIKTFISLSSGYAYETALKEFSSTGGIDIGSAVGSSEEELKYPCGSFLYELWNDESKECYPDYRKDFLGFFDEQLNSYLLQYPASLPFHNYYYELNEQGNKLLLKAIAKKPIKIDIKIGEAEAGKVFKPYSGGLLISPLKDYSEIASCFGYRGNVGDGSSLNHPGIDIPAPRNTEVVAAASGTVFSIDRQTWGRIILDHGEFMTEYMHLNQIVASLKKGDQINQGEVIGYVGGRGPKGASQYANHLHFGVIDENPPASLLGPDNYDLILTSFGIKAYVNPLCFFDQSAQFQFSDSLACHASSEGFCNPLRQCSKGTGAYKGCDQYPVLQRLGQQTSNPGPVIQGEKHACTAEADLNQLNWNIKDDRMSMETLQQLIDSRNAEEYVKEASRKYSVPEEIIKAFMRVESRKDLWEAGYNCKGDHCNVMQTSEDVCKDADECSWDRVRTSDGIRDSIMAGTRYLSQLMKGEEGCKYIDKDNPDYYKVALCYNAGGEAQRHIISEAAARVLKANPDPSKDEDKKASLNWKDVTIEDVRNGLKKGEYEGKSLYALWGEKKVTEAYPYPHRIMLGLSQYCGDTYVYQPTILGSYEFMPHFTLTKDNDFLAIDKLIEFSKKTVDTCSKEISVKDCVEKQSNEFNKNNYEVFVSLGCEDRAEKPLYNFVEAIEYCKLSQDTDCVCETQFEKGISLKESLVQYQTVTDVELPYQLSLDDFNYDVQYSDDARFIGCKMEQGSHSIKMPYCFKIILEKKNGVRMVEQSSLKACPAPVDYKSFCDKALEQNDQGLIELCNSNSVLAYFIDEYEQCRAAPDDNCYCEIILTDRMQQNFGLSYNNNKLSLKRQIKASYPYDYNLKTSKTPEEQSVQKDALELKPEHKLYKKSNDEYVFIEEAGSKKACKLIKDKFRFCARYRNKPELPEIKFGLTIRERIPPAILNFDASKNTMLYGNSVILSWTTAQEPDFDHYRIYHSKYGFNTKQAADYVQIKSFDLGQPDEVMPEGMQGGCEIESMPHNKYVQCMNGQNYYIIDNADSLYFAVVAVDEVGNEAQVYAKLAVENAGTN